MSLEGKNATCFDQIQQKSISPCVRREQVALSSSDFVVRRDQLIERLIDDDDRINRSCYSQKRWL